MFVVCFGSHCLGRLTRDGRLVCVLSSDAFLVRPIILSVLVLQKEFSKARCAVNKGTLKIVEVVLLRGPIKTTHGGGLQRTRSFALKRSQTIKDWRGGTWKRTHAIKRTESRILKASIFQMLHFLDLVCQILNLPNIEFPRLVLPNVELKIVEGVQDAKENVSPLRLCFF